MLGFHWGTLWNEITGIHNPKRETLVDGVFDFHVKLFGCLAVPISDCL
jgi:hypothetical protein